MRSFALIAMAAAASAKTVDVGPFKPDGMTFKFHIYAPDTTETVPVIFFVSGLSGLAPVASYSKVLKQIADKGYMVVGLDHIAMINYPKQGQDFHDLLEWAGQGNLATELTKHKVTAVPDVANRAAVMGQSAGNHVVGQGLVDGCSIAKAQIMIDPVDGFDPFGVIQSENLIIPGQKLGYTIPALHLDNYLDPKGGLAGISCSPASLSGPRWFDAMAGPVWNVNATQYGHIDCLDELTAIAAGVVCPTNNKASNKPYRAMLADTVTTFLGALFDGSADDFDLLEDASKFGVEVDVRQDLKGLAHNQIKPGCTNSGVIV